jgi:hypothetical protein
MCQIVALQLLPLVLLQLFFDSFQSTTKNLSCPVGQELSLTTAEVGSLTNIRVSQLGGALGLLFCPGTQG